MEIKRLLLLVASAALTLCSQKGFNHQADGIEESSLLFLRSEESFTFEYSTSKPDAHNWIGLYHEAGVGLIMQEGSPYTKDPVVWKYAPESEGKVHLPVDSLKPGRYTAFFLAKDGFKWLSYPIDVFHADPAVEPISFYVDEVTLPNARQGDLFRASISKLLKAGQDLEYRPWVFGMFSSSERKPKFWLGSWSSWLYVNQNGEFFGTPDKKARDTTVLVWAIQGKAVTSINVHIRVRPWGAPLLDKVNVMTFNTWLGGKRVNNYLEKQLRFLTSSNADIVGIQEVQGGEHTVKLAETLGWYHWNGGSRSVGILSKYPIWDAGQTEVTGGVMVELDEGWQQMYFFATHLAPHPYGPYYFCYEGMGEKEVMGKEEESRRPQQVDDTLAEMQLYLEAADEIPVVLVGDFNSPSHLDWIESNQHNHCNSTFKWPATAKVTEAGMVDSYRVAHPDPSADPGITYSIVTPWNDDYNGPEPQDRIDFVFHKGKNLRVLKSEAVVVGEPRELPDVADNEWTSDHSAVLTTYEYVDDYSYHELMKRKTDLDSVKQVCGVEIKAELYG